MDAKETLTALLVAISGAHTREAILATNKLIRYVKDRERPDEIEQFISVLQDRLFITHRRTT